VLDATGSLVTSGTTSVTISKDAGTFANPAAGATSATQIATTSGVWYVDLGTADTNCDTLAVKFTNAGGKDTVLVIYPVEIKELSAAPAFTDGLEEAISWLLALSRNRITQTASTTTLYKNDGTTSQSTAAVSDNGTTFTRAKWA